MIQKPKGTFDVLRDEQDRRASLSAIAAGLFGSAGFVKIDTPMFESTELFKRGVGDTTSIVQKEMFTFEDNAQRSLTLRPEGTAPVVRAYIENGMNKLPGPVKLWYEGAFFRLENPQAGRQRQFSQIGAEIIGAASPLADAELIQLMDQLLMEADCATELKINSLGSVESRAEYQKALQTFMRANIQDLGVDARARIEDNPLRAFDAKDEATQKVMASAPLLADFLSSADKENFEAVKEFLAASKVQFEVDLRLVRGLDYYSKTVFEFSSNSLGAQSGVAGGGRYDGLVEQLGGQPTPASGMAAGVERILLAQKSQQATERVVNFAVVKNNDVQAEALALAVATALRKTSSVALDLSNRSMNGQIKAAGKTGAKAIVMVTDEIVVRIRDQKDQSFATVEELTSALGL